MSRPVKRPSADHKQIAEALRQQPHVWLRVGDYRNHLSADNVARRIRRGYPIGDRAYGTPYQPTGAYEARLERIADGTRVHARYTGGAE
ncbi:MULTISPECIES: hypothetical protein [Streptomyces]|uniref:Uncharacterized protein n=1 Tax=Streptomyces bangladeshensis TaxID=295352 RepID=A0ABN3BS98_9ACTN|nr:hypothetical protein [Streptomyces sp. FBKL.4005]OYP14014.1 hypothetical protein CFC35_05470 [Streptomyces sp. FBKL.4005]